MTTNYLRLASVAALVASIAAQPAPTEAGDGLPEFKIKTDTIVRCELAGQWPDLTLDNIIFCFPELPDIMSRPPKSNDNGLPVLRVKPGENILVRCAGDWEGRSPQMWRIEGTYDGYLVCRRGPLS